MAILQKDTHTSPDLQIRPSLIHPFLPQDKLLIQMHLDACNARALWGFIFFYEGSAENIILRQAHGSGLWAAGPPACLGAHVFYLSAFHIARGRYGAGFRCCRKANTQN